MLVHAKDIITDVDAKMIQPNAVDVRLHSLDLMFPTTTTITFAEHGPKAFLQRIPLELDQHQRWMIRGPAMLDFTTLHEVEIPSQMCGWVVPRSTLVRNGVVIASGLYDSGYKGIIGGVMHVPAGAFEFEYGTRIGQFVLAQAETVGMYDGYYNKTNGVSR